VSTETIPGKTLPANGTPGRSAWIGRAWIAVVTWVRKEPSATQAIILAFIAIGIAFQWWHWSNGQIGAVVGIAAALLGMFVRSQVTPLIEPTSMGRRFVPTTDEPKAAASRGK
jgi:hypothetical protein